MKKQKQLLLTFDYEPYLGRRSGTADKCVLEPTEALKIILDRSRAKAVFFVDVLYLQKLREYKEQNENYLKIMRQLLSLFKDGHYIFPHIHPHWLDSVYEKNLGQFDLSNLSRYSMANVEQSEIERMFKESVSFLSEHGISYSVWGYRAGGWCIQPFSKFKNAFVENKICFEFSVMPGYKNEAQSQYFNFSMVKKKEPYYFSDCVEKPERSGPFLEFPISTISLSSFTGFKSKIISKYLWNKGERGWGNGLSAQTAALKSDSSQQEMISVDILNGAKLGSYKKFVRLNDYMHWVSHPKMFTKHALKIFENFLSYANKNFTVNYDFMNMIPEKN